MNSYRRNVDWTSSPRSGLRALREVDYDRIFERLHYSGSLNPSFIRLLACLDFYPALEILREMEGIERTRFGVQFPLIDFNELDQIIFKFSDYFTAKAVKATFFLIRNDVRPLIDMRALQTLQQLGMYLEEYEYYIDSCHQVIEGSNEAIGSLEQGMALGGGLAAIFGPAPQGVITEHGPDLVRFLSLIIDYLNKLCGKCPNCDIYHSSESADFSLPVSKFRRDIIFEAFQIARKYDRGRDLKKDLIPYVFKALEMRPIHAQLQRYPVEERVHQREEEQRDMFNRYY